MDLPGELELARKRVAEAGRGGVKLTAPAGALSGPPTRAPSCAFELKLYHSKELQGAQSNVFSGPCPPPLIATSNTEFEAHPAGCALEDAGLRALILPDSPW